jgi:hypothetical protein
MAAIGAGTAALGVLFVFAAHSTPMAPMHDAALPVFWGAEQPPEAARRYAFWAHGVLGGVLAGWGVLVIGIALGPFKRREPWAWWCLLIAFVGWFVLDSGASVAYGVTFNAWLNLGALAITAVPIVATARDRRRADG